MLTRFPYAIVQFHVCVPVPKCTSVGEGKKVYIRFTLKASEQSFSFTGKELCSPFARQKIPLQAKKISNFFRDNRFFLKTRHKINKNIISLLMSKCPPPKLAQPTVHISQY